MITGREDVFMGKVKVVSKNNQVSVKVKSTKGEQLNHSMAELLSKTAVEGFLPFHIASDGNAVSQQSMEQRDMRQLRSFLKTGL